MKYHTLGADLKVAAVGFGCMGFSHAYGKAMEKSEAVKLIQQAVEIGYDFFDTAEMYGPYINEEIVGEALRPYRDKMVIATKFGIYLEQGTVGAPIPDGRPEVIRRAVEGSLKRLQVECIDLYYQHRTDPKVPAEEVAGVMADLIAEGKISHWGISQVDEHYLRRAHSVCPVTAVQNRYSMMARGYESLFPVLEELNIGLVSFSPLANGFLSGKYNGSDVFTAEDYRGNMPQFKKENVDKNKALLALLKDIANDKNATMAQISLAWMICKKPWIVPIPGSRKLNRMQENFAAGNIELSQGEIAAIDTALDNMELSEVFMGTKSSS